MEWLNVILTIIGSGGLATVLSFVVYRKQNKTIKDNEAKATDLSIEEKQLELDRKQIDLGNEFMKSSLEMTKKMQDMMLQNQTRDEQNWKQMFSRMDSIERSVTNIRLYLNGGLAEFEEGLKNTKFNDYEKNETEQMQRL
jgi:hypothetical protein